MTKQKIPLGLAVMIVIQFCAEKLMVVFGSEQSLYGTTPSILIALIAAFAGGWIAQHRFLIPALLLWAALWCVVVYLLYRIAAPVDPTALTSIFQHNIVAIASSGTGTAIGATLGQMLGGRRARGVAAT